MSSLTSIPGIGKTSLELLEAAGFRDAESLLQAGVEGLAVELEKANRILKISSRTPSRKQITQWLDHIRGGSEQPGTQVTSTLPVNYEETRQVRSLLAHAPFAIPLPSQILVRNKLGVSDIPPAILLNRHSGDLEIRVERRLPAIKQPRPAASASPDIRVVEPAVVRTETDMSRFRTFGDAAKLSRSGLVRLESREHESVSLLRAPRESTNRGRDPQSRWYIRGVLHSNPIAIRMGALATLLLLCVIPLALVSTLLLMLSGEFPKSFSWVPGWLLAFPLALPPVGFFYLICGLGGKCRICGQKLFIHRAHLKNPKAHHVPVIGYVFPLCLQILIFQWFRCTHCGTPVRLKE